VLQSKAFGVAFGAAGYDAAPIAWYAVREKKSKFRFA
jgi:hypothetical protein